MNNKLFYLCALAAIAFIGCKNEDELTSSTDAMTNTEITVKVGVNKLNAYQKPAQTHVGHESGDLSTGALGLFLTTQGTEGDARYNAANREVVYENGTWNITGNSLLWRNATANVTYYAYHPYNSQIESDVVDVKTPTNQVIDGVNDFLYTSGQTTGQESKDGIDLQFEHQMTKLIINLRSGTELGENPTFTSIQLPNFATSRPFNLLTGKWEEMNTSDSLVIMMVPNADGKSFEAIFIPQRIATFQAIIEVEDGRMFVYNQSGVEFLQGYAYTLNLLVGKDIITAEGITATEWQDGNTGDDNLETE